MKIERISTEAVKQLKSKSMKGTQAQVQGTQDAQGGQIMNQEAMLYTYHADTLMDGAKI